MTRRKGRPTKQTLSGAFNATLLALVALIPLVTFPARADSPWKEEAKEEAKWVEEEGKARAKAIEEDAKGRAKWIEEQGKMGGKADEERAKAHARAVEEWGKANAKVEEEDAKTRAKAIEESAPD